jgi:hypothetical protein
MSNERTILAIGRIERALSKLEQYRPPSPSSGAENLQLKHDRFKTEVQNAIAEIDRLLIGGIV